jgi:hypothetical protein
MVGSCVAHGIKLYTSSVVPSPHLPGEGPPPARGRGNARVPGDHAEDLRFNLTSLHPCGLVYQSRIRSMQPRRMRVHGEIDIGAAAKKKVACRCTHTDCLLPGVHTKLYCGLAVRVTTGYMKGLWRLDALCGHVPRRENLWEETSAGDALHAIVIGAREVAAGW